MRCSYSTVVLVVLRLSRVEEMFESSRWREGGDDQITSNMTVRYEDCVYRLPPHGVDTTTRYTIQRTSGEIHNSFKCVIQYLEGCNKTILGLSEINSQCKL